MVDIQVSVCGRPRGVISCFPGHEAERVNRNWRAATGLCHTFQGILTQIVDAKRVLTPSQVWTAWVATIPENVRPRLLERNLLRDTSRELQRLETRCVLKPGSSTDGAGSSAMRTVSNWMFAEALGEFDTGPSIFGPHQPSLGVLEYVPAVLLHA